MEYKLTNIIGYMHECCCSIYNNETMNTLLDKLITKTQKLLSSDGVSLYLSHNETLEFHYLNNHSLNIEWGPESSQIKQLAPIHISTEANKSMSACCAAEKRTIDFILEANVTSLFTQHSKRFDQQFNYLTHSVLSVPIKNNLNEVLGVMQFINALDVNGQAINFSQESIKIAEIMAVICGNLLQSRKVA